MRKGLEDYSGCLSSAGLAVLSGTACAPITKSVLLSCLTGHRKSSATEIKKKGSTKCRMADSAKIISVCCCILLRARIQRMNALQMMVSLIHYCGHASIRVIA